MPNETKQEFLDNLDTFIRITKNLGSFRGKTAALRTLTLLRERISRK